MTGSQLAVQFCQQLFPGTVKLVLSMSILVSIYFSLHIFTGNKGCEYQSRKPEFFIHKQLLQSTLSLKMMLSLP